MQINMDSLPFVTKKREFSRDINTIRRVINQAKNIVQVAGVVARRHC